MNDEEFEQFVRSALRLRKPPEVSDEEIREFLATPTDLPPGTAEEVRALFLDKVFRKFHPEPIWRVQEGEQFGPWFRALRKNVRLPPGEIAAAIGEPRSFMEELEGGEVPPWQINPDPVAKLMILYRVHILAVESLVKNAEGATLPVTPPPPAARPAVEGRAMMLGPESGTKLAPEVAQWLEELRAALRRRKARRLLGFGNRMGLTLGGPGKKN